MKKTVLKYGLLALALTLMWTGCSAVPTVVTPPTSNITSTDEKTTTSDHLVVVWTSDDPYVAQRVALMYTHEAKKNKWFNDVTLIIWGPSAKLIAENTELQTKLKEMIADGVKVEACIACSDAYNTTEILLALGYDVKLMGVSLTNYLKGDAKVLTF